MEQKNIFKGVALVAIGASCYGMLATFVKKAYMEGFTTAEVTSSQFTIGLIGLFIINLIYKYTTKKPIPKASKSDVFRLMSLGSSLGFTSVFYYLSVKYIPVSIGIVLLVQSIWMSVLLEGIITKKIPNTKKIIAVIIILLGTFLATNAIDNGRNLDSRGIVLGILAALSFTTTMYTNNRVVTYLSTPQRSLYMLMGGAVIVFTFAFITQTTPYNFGIIKWGIFLALFGTILTPIFMNLGFPHTGIGLGSIVSSLELPVSVMMAFVFLNEQVLAVQWFGIILILLSIVLMNINLKSINFGRKS